MNDYTKLIERLRTDAIFDNTTLGNEAADAIEALQGENERLNNEMAAGAQNMRWMMKSHNKNYDTLTAERDALAAEVAGLKAQEPVGFVAPHEIQNLREGYPSTVVMLPSNKRTEPLYAAPKAQEPLTEERVTEIYNEVCADWVNRYNRPLIFASAIEAAHGIGGTP